MEVDWVCSSTNIGSFSILTGCNLKDWAKLPSCMCPEEKEDCDYWRIWEHAPSLKGGGESAPSARTVSKCENFDPFFKRVFFVSNLFQNTYGSVSAGREKWPFNVLFFFKSRASV